MALGGRGGFDHLPSYLTSLTSIPDTAKRKFTPWPSPVRIMNMPLSFRMVVAAAHGDTNSPPNILPFKVCDILQVINVAHSCRLFERHSHDAEATDVKSTL
jgi:hypothetical protein